MPTESIGKEFTLIPPVRKKKLITQWLASVTEPLNVSTIGSSATLGDPDGVFADTS